MHPNDNSEGFWGHQLTNDNFISSDQYETISTLIFETDSYIYPSLFESEVSPKEAAIKILPLVFESGNDAMFCKKNLFLFYRGASIVGLILWNKGQLNWDTDLFLQTAKSIGVTLKRTNVIAVRDGYVDAKYSEENTNNEQVINLINICVDADNRGMGVGKLMMTAFLAEHSPEPMELCVLADNVGAIKLYKKMGFKIVGETIGFSLSNEKPRCYDMRKEKMVK